MQGQAFRLHDHLPRPQRPFRHQRRRSSGTAGIHRHQNVFHRGGRRRRDRDGDAEGASRRVRRPCDDPLNVGIVKIWIIRHAKSSWAEPGLSDFDRPLNERGKADGPRMAAWLASQDAPAQWIWTSDAARARATAAFVEQGFAAARPQVVEEHALYHATAHGIVDVLRGTPEAVTSVALVAHNPGLTDLVNMLAGEAVTENLPTFGVARFEVAAAWHSLGEGRASLEILTAPKKIPS
ncbi:MAG: hypothetical protein EP301_08405 [Gammaproteobacteria bacterium]|nr:MAG: hypothetical protein EP301_08405 [Gammaproteobacteria bacterium]